jgi:virulence-associated protein VagC
MIVNSDERQWAWMDEGFNIFIQGLSEREWDINQSWSGKPTEMIGYMNSPKNTQVPLMTDADALLQGGMNSYRKPASGLNILRETILGRELFDQAFKQYSQTWMFKHPQPADFFRIMEDASGVDLDWFWREWFFTTDHVDLSISNVTVFEPVFDEPSATKAAQYKSKLIRPDIATIRDQGQFVSEIDRDKTLRDKYNEPEPVLSDGEKTRIDALYNRLTPEEIKQLKSGQRYYQITFKALGGMIMPLVIEFEFEDGTTDEVRIPAEIWLRNQQEVTKVFIYDKEVRTVTLDPHQETADVDTSNNRWPKRTERVFFNIRK